MLFTIVHELLALRRWCQREQRKSCDLRYHDWQKPKAQVRFKACSCLQNFYTSVTVDCDLFSAAIR